MSSLQPSSQAPSAKHFAVEGQVTIPDRRANEENTKPSQSGARELGKSKEKREKSEKSEKRERSKKGQRKDTNRAEGS